MSSQFTSYALLLLTWVLIGFIVYLEYRYSVLLEERDALERSQ